MTLRPGEAAGRAIAVFPFLKTTEPIQLGSFNFRSTEDTTGLSGEDSAHVREIAEMLYLQDDFRVRSASYALLPALDLDKAEPPLMELEHLQAVVAYCYSAPHPTLGDPFLHFEQASLAIFSPEPVPIFMVRPEHHVQEVVPSPKLDADQWHRVPGYQGRYNFRHAFWVTKGSRVYGRQIFQLCTGTLLFGAHLGERAGLRNKLVTNQERFELICKTLDNDSLTVADRFAAIDETVAVANEFRFVGETGILIKTLTGAVQRAAKNLLLCGDPLEPAFKERLEKLSGAQPSHDSYEALAALQAIKDWKRAEPTSPGSPEAITERLSEIVWHYTFMHYYWLKEERDKATRPE